MTMLDFAILFVGALVLLVGHTPVLLTIIVTIAVLILVRWLLGERLRRKS